MDIKRLCLLRKLKETATIIDGWDSSRQWKRRADSAVIPDTLLFQVRKIPSQKYEELLPRFLEAKALAFSSDYDAIEAMNFFFDKGIRVPDQISITGYDDSMYASMVRPKLTTVHRGCPEKSTYGSETSDEADPGRRIEGIKYKKSGLSGKEGFCQRMIEFFFFCLICIKTELKLC